MAWWRTVLARLLELGYVQSKLDSGIFYKYNSRGKLTSMLTIHVDDLLVTGTDADVQYLRENLGFEIGSWKTSEFVYCGVHYKQDASYAVHYDMASYELMSDKVETSGSYSDDGDMLTAADVSKCRSAIGNLAWYCSRMRPECIVSVNKAAQHIFTYKAVKLINKVVKQLDLEKVEYMSFLPLELDSLDTLHLVAMSDAAYGDPSQLGASYLLCGSEAKHGLVGRSVRCNLLHFETKVRKGLRS